MEIPGASAPGECDADGRDVADEGFDRVAGPSTGGAGGAATDRPGPLASQRP
jgi:hypothetical protein